MCVIFMSKMPSIKFLTELTKIAKEREEKLQLKEINKQIVWAAERGLNSIFIDDDITKKNLKKLKANGFIVKGVDPPHCGYIIKGW